MFGLTYPRVFGKHITGLRLCCLWRTKGSLVRVVCNGCRLAHSQPPTSCWPPPGLSHRQGISPPPSPCFTLYASGAHRETGHLFCYIPYFPIGRRSEPMKLKSDCSNTSWDMWTPAQEALLKFLRGKPHIPAYYGGQRRKGDQEADWELGKHHKVREKTRPRREVLPSRICVKFLRQIHGWLETLCLRGGLQVHSPGAPIQMA